MAVESAVTAGEVCEVGGKGTNRSLRWGILAKCFVLRVRR